jgi:hypothetical protein
VHIQSTIRVDQQQPDLLRRDQGLDFFHILSRQIVGKDRDFVGNPIEVEKRSDSYQILVLASEIDVGPP